MYIISELDELEREEFYRLKKIQDKKKIVRAKADKEKALQRAANLAAENAAPVRNILDESEDTDLLF